MFVAVAPHGGVSSPLCIITGTYCRRRYTDDNDDNDNVDIGCLNICSAEEICIRSNQEQHDAIHGVIDKIRASPEYGTHKICLIVEDNLVMETHHVYGYVNGVDHLEMPRDSPDRPGVHTSLELCKMAEFVIAKKQVRIETIGPVVVVLDMARKLFGNSDPLYNTLLMLVHYVHLQRFRGGGGGD